MPYSEFQCVARCCSVCTAVNQALKQEGKASKVVCNSVLHCVAVYCSVLQCVAVRCCVLQCVQSSRNLRLKTISTANFHTQATLEKNRVLIITNSISITNSMSHLNTASHGRKISDFKQLLLPVVNFIEKQLSSSFQYRERKQVFRSS